MDREKLEVGRIYGHPGLGLGSVGTELFEFKGSEGGGLLFEARNGEDKGGVFNLTKPQIDALFGPLDKPASPS